MTFSQRFLVFAEPTTVGLRTRITSWMRCALVFIAVTGLAQKSDASSTIHVNTTDPGITDGLCSLQEAIYSAEFGTNIAISHTDQDITYTTGCEPGTGNGDTIVLQGGETYSFYKSWDGDAH